MLELYIIGIIAVSVTGLIAREYQDKIFDFIMDLAKDEEQK